MLSSVAERVYWLGRYMERVENSARLMDVYSSMLFDLPGSADIGWGVLLDITGSRESFDETHAEINEYQVMKFLISDTSNHSSVVSCMKMLRENARTTREILPSEAWEQINDLYLDTKKRISVSMGRQARRDLFDIIISDCQRLSGLLSGCLTHNTAYTFIQIGRCLERADMSTRIVDVGSISLLPAFKQFRQEGAYIEPFENVVWMNILRCLSAYQAYRQHVHNRVVGAEVVRFLLQDEEFPKAVNYCLAALNMHLQKLPNHEEVQRAALRVKRITTEAKVDALLEKGLLDFIDELQISIADIHAELSNTWFKPIELVEKEVTVVINSLAVKKVINITPSAKTSPVRSEDKDRSADKGKPEDKVRAKSKARPKSKAQTKEKVKVKAKVKSKLKAGTKAKAKSNLKTKKPAKAPAKTPVKTKK